MVILQARIRQEHKCLWYVIRLWKEKVFFSSRRAGKTRRDFLKQAVFRQVLRKLCNWCNQVGSISCCRKWCYEDKKCSVYVGMSTEYLDEGWGRSRRLVRCMASWCLVEDHPTGKLVDSGWVYLKGKVYLKLNTNSLVFLGPVCPLPRIPQVPFTTHLHFFQKEYVCFDPHRFRPRSLFQRTTLRLLQPPQSQDQRVRCSSTFLAPFEDRLWKLPGLQSSLQGDAESTPGSWSACLSFLPLPSAFPT